LRSRINDRILREDGRRLGLDASDSAFRLDADAIIDGAANTLLAAQITFGRLDGDVPEKKLYLFQFSTDRMAEPGTRPAEVVGRKPLNACIVGVLPDDLPDGFLRSVHRPRFSRSCLPAETACRR